MGARGFGALAIALAFYALCASAGKAAPSPQASGDSYFVLGLAPREAHIVIASGTVTNGMFSRSAASTVMRFRTSADAIENGFVVGKIRGGTTLGLVSVSDRTNWPDPKYSLCGPHARMLTFTPPPGAVVYITSLKFRHADRSFSPSYKDDIDTARAFLMAHYPELAEKLKQGRYNLVTGSAACSAKD